MILENTIIENTKGCFMGKMILDDLRKRLERLDEDADLMIDNDDRYQMVIVGGSAFILLGKLTRATHDIDALSVPKELYGLLGKYDINTDVEAYIDNFPYNFQDRLQPRLSVVQRYSSTHPVWKIW